MRVLALCDPPMQWLGGLNALWYALRADKRIRNPEGVRKVLAAIVAEYKIVVSATAIACAYDPGQELLQVELDKLKPDTVAWRLSAEFALVLDIHVGATEESDRAIAHQYLGLLLFHDRVGRLAA